MEAGLIVCETLLGEVHKHSNFPGAKFNDVPESSPGDQQEVLLVGKRS
jgi:hypothetical protein